MAAAAPPAPAMKMRRPRTPVRAARGERGVRKRGCTRLQDGIGDEREDRGPAGDL